MPEAGDPFERDPFLADARALEGFPAVLAAAAARRETFARRFRLADAAPRHPSP